MPFIRILDIIHPLSRAIIAKAVMVIAEFRMPIGIITSKPNLMRLDRLCTPVQTTRVVIVLYAMAMTIRRPHANTISILAGRVIATDIMMLTIWFPVSVVPERAMVVIMIPRISLSVFSRLRQVMRSLRMPRVVRLVVRTTPRTAMILQQRLLRRMRPMTSRV